MADWYYAHNQEQQGPVSWDELRRLASTGRLSRQDMVWSDGMADWKKASLVEGLFADAAAITAGAKPAAALTSRTAATATTATPRRGSRAPTDEEPIDIDDDLARRKKKKRQEGMSPGALAGIIGGCVAGGLMILVIVIVLIVRTGNRQPEVAAAPAGGAAGAGGPGPQSYVVVLREDQQNLRSFNFEAGQNVTITVSTRGGILQSPDVDLEVTRAGDANFFVLDDALSSDCFINFIAPAADQYTLRLDNLGPGTATCTVNIR